MLALIRTTLGGGGDTKRLLPLGALLALLAAALLTLAPAAADGHPDDLELILSIVDDSDNIVPPGSEFTVEAELRFSLPHTQERRLSAATDSWLRLAGDLHWEETAFKRLDVAQQLVMGGTPLFGVDAAGAALGSTARMVARAADGRLIVARAHTNKLYLFDAWNKRQVGIIDAPAGAHASTFGGATTLSDSDLRGVRSVATWQEDEDTWWIFAGSRYDQIDTYARVGRLYIFRIDWTDAGVQIGAPTIIHPSADEFRNRHSAAATDTRTEYGYSLNISRDGSTLAVVAPYMNHMGAVYIYSRPDGPGEDWSDITHADAVKATPAVVPAWGTGVATTRPFDHTSTGRTDASTDCDAWCSAVWAEDVIVGNNWSPPHRIGLSADGRVIAVGRPGKRYASTTPGGSFSSPKNFTGEIQVYAAPAGGWSAAPRADEGGRTLFATRADASGFKPAQHYAAGPLRRVTETSAKLTIAPWAEATGGNYFAPAVDVSNDGTVVVSSAFSPGYAHVFQLDPGEEWSGDMVYTARLQDTPIAGNNGGVEFSGDDRTIAIGNIDAYGQAGEIYIYTRPANGVWVTAERSHESARTILSPEGRIGNRWWGEVLYDLGGERLIISAFRHAGGALWLSDGGCAQRVADGAASWTCPVNLTDATVVVQSGVAEGPVTISGSVKVSVSDVEDSEITLRDTLELTVAEVDELAKVELDFDTNAATGRPYSSVVGPGESATLLLQLLNEHDAASAKGAIASVLFTTSQGKLSAKLAAGDTEACETSGAISCSIRTPATTLTAGNSDKIRLTVEHPGAGKSGRTGVRATVIGIDGESFEVGPIELIFSGPASELAIAAPSRGLLSHDTCDAPAADGPEGCKIAADRDDRDLLTLSVAARDASGNPADVPTRAYIPAKVTGPDGKRVGADKIAVTWPLRLAGSTALDTSVDGAPQAQINVNAPATEQLPAGEYTVELSVDRLTARQTFSVSGPPAEVALSEPPSGLSVRDSFTVSATITDAGGAPVPDGTPVNWSATPIAAASTLVETASQRRTINGKAEATWLVVAPGRTTLRAAAGEITSVALVEVAGPPAPPVRLLDQLAAPYTQGSNIWFGAFSIRASALLRELPNAEVVHIWQSNRWYRYSQVEGEQGEESIDFTIHPNAVLWFGDDN